ncbi:PEP-CTERM sorting domain-containing protein [Phycisphaeraceae bacterium D3-23]
MQKILPTLIGTAALVAAMPAAAAPVIDGSNVGDGYGSAITVQTTETQFGDNLSELNAAYGVIDSGVLYLMLTGNIENNFNKLNIFIDSAAGGQNSFISSGNDNAGNMNGMIFDSGFTADYHMILRRGNAGTDIFDVDFADLSAGTFSNYGDVFGGSQTGSGTTGTGVNANGIQVAYDDSNAAGVLGGTAAANTADALAVTTGIEIAINLSDLGWNGTDDVNVMVGVNNQDHNFWSNQFLGGLGTPGGNLGGDGAGNFTGTGDVDFSAIAGDQFFTVQVPEPGSLALLGLGGLALLRRRR